jgi:hypothetical protein
MNPTGRKTRTQKWVGGIPPHNPENVFLIEFDEKGRSSVVKGVEKGERGIIILLKD